MEKPLYRELRIKIIRLTLAPSPQVLLSAVIYHQFARAHESRMVDQMGQLAGSQSSAVGGVSAGTHRYSGHAGGNQRL